MDNHSFLKNDREASPDQPSGIVLSLKFTKVLNFYLEYICFKYCVDNLEVAEYDNICIRIKIPAYEFFSKSKSPNISCEILKQ